jgi:BirA family transcriptional regulator, biotin operon repressor / biotin---[acetyl-CoA-carboxylase] ligase
MNQMNQPNQISWNTLFFDEIDSTNEFIKRQIDNLSNFTVIVANYQTNGRGQFDRKWLSNPNENLLCSILLKTVGCFITENLNTILVQTLLNTLKQYNIEATYKSPNDIYVNHLKIAGILVERSYENQNLRYTIIGIGLNVNQVEFPVPTATSMHNETGSIFLPRDILNTLLINFEKQYRLFSTDA